MSIAVDWIFDTRKIKNHWLAYITKLFFNILTICEIFMQYRVIEKSGTTLKLIIRKRVKKNRCFLHQMSAPECIQVFQHKMKNECLNSSFLLICRLKDAISSSTKVRRGTTLLAALSTVSCGTTENAGNDVFFTQIFIFHFVMKNVTYRPPIC